MNELEIKTERLVKTLNSEKLGGVLLNSQHNFAWLTGGGNNGVDLSRENGVASLFIRNDGKRFLFASKIEMPRILAEEISENDFEPIEFQWEADKINPVYLLESAQKLTENDLPVAADIFYSPNFRVVEGAIAKCRFELVGEEIQRFKKLGNDAGEILGSIHQKIKTGQTEREIANIVKYELGKVDINSVVTLVAADERTSNFRHPVPSENIWKKIVMIVVCAKRHGLIASLSRIFSVGNISDELRRKTDGVAKVHAEMIHATQPNAIAKDIFEITKKSYASVGFPIEETKHHQGGACSYKTRDWVAHSESNEKVHINQCFAWNPSITGTKSEETILVTENEREIITKSPDFPTISNVIDGIEYKTPDIFIL